MEHIYTFVGKDLAYNLKNIELKINELNIANNTIIKIDYEDSNISKVIEELNTISFFVENKIVILYNANFLSSQESDKYDSFLKYLNNPNETTYLFISIPDLNQLSKSFKDAIINNTIVIDSKELSPDQFFDYIKNILKDSSYSMNDDAVNELIKRSNEDYNLLNNNIEKLMVYKFDSKNITLNDVYTMITKDLDSNVFDLVEAVIDKDKKKAYDIYLDLKASNVDDSSILGSLIFKFREMALTKKLVTSGTPKQELAQILNVKEGRAYFMIKNVSNYNLDTLVNKLNELLDIDYKSKIGLLDLEKSLLTWIIR